MRTRTSYSDRLDDLLSGLPPRDTGPRRAGQAPDETQEEPQPGPEARLGDETPPGRETREPLPAAPTRPPLVFGRAHLSALGVVLVLVLAVVAVMLLRSRATAVPVAAVSVSPVATASPAGQTPVPSTAPDSPSASPATGPSAGPATIRVHVAGRVRHPNVYALAEGSRAIDAVRAAGGLSAGAHPGSLNLAAPVCDGCQVMIPASGDGTITGPDGAGDGSASSPGAPASPSAGGQTGGQAGGDERIDLNSAGAEELQTLDGVGPATAAKIIAWRTQHGRFSDVSELQEIDGIGPKTYARLKDHVRV